MRHRIGDIDPGAEHGHRHAAGSQRRTVCGGINASRHAAHDACSRGCERRSDRIGRSLAVGRGTTRSDDGDGRPREQAKVAEHEEVGRRIVQLEQRGRVVCILAEQEPSAAGVAVARDSSGLVT